MGDVKVGDKTFHTEIVENECDVSYEDNVGRSNMHHSTKRMSGTVKVLTPFGILWCEYNLREEGDGPIGSVHWTNSIGETDALVEMLNADELSPVDSYGDINVESVLENYAEEVTSLVEKATESASTDEIQEALEFFRAAQAELKGRRVVGRIGKLPEELYRSGRFLRQESLAACPEVQAEHAKAVLRTKQQAENLLKSLPKSLPKAERAMQSLVKQMKAAVTEIPRDQFLERIAQAYDELAKKTPTNRGRSCG